MLPPSRPVRIESNRTVTHRHRPGSAGVPVSTAGRSVFPTACTGAGRCGACCGSA
jgi:hypothetical protein